MCDVIGAGVAVAEWTMGEVGHMGKIPVYRGVSHGGVIEWTSLYDGSFGNGGAMVACNGYDLVYIKISGNLNVSNPRGTPSAGYARATVTIAGTATQISQSFPEYAGGGGARGISMEGSRFAVTGLGEIGATGIGGLSYDYAGYGVVATLSGTMLVAGGKLRP